MFEFFTCLEGDEQFDWISAFIAERLHAKYPLFFNEASRIFDEKVEALEND